MRVVAIDTETTGLNRWTGARPFMVSARWDNGDGDLWEWEVDPMTRRPIIPRGERAELIEIMSDETILKVFFNAKFDLFMLESVGVRCPLRTSSGVRLVDEVSFMARVCNNLEKVFALKHLAKKYVKIDDDDQDTLHKATVSARRVAKKAGWAIATEDTHGKKPVKADYWTPAAVARLMPEEAERLNIDGEACSLYAMTDVDRTIDLHSMYGEVMTDDDLWKPYDDEMTLLGITMSMEREGVTVDRRRMNAVAAECRKKSSAALKRMTAATGIEGFNPNSSKHVQRMMFGGEPLSLEIIKHTESGNASTDAEVKVAYQHEPLVRDLLVFNTSSKATSSFFNKYDKLATIDPRLPARLRVLHPGYNQMGTLTWRFTCTEPNLQQISSPESSRSWAREYLVDIRQVFVPRPGKVWIAPDYSQVEVIIFADIFQIQSMIDAILTGDDMHTATTEKIYGGEDNPRALVAADQILQLAGIERRTHDIINEMNGVDWRISELESKYDQKGYRTQAKSTTFTKIFGGGPKALMGWIPGLTFTGAKQILKDYDDAFPEMAQKMEDIIAQGMRDGFVMTPWGTRLSVDRWAAYKVVNHVVQHSAAILMKRGMIKCHEFIQRQRIRARIAMTIHDELVFEFDEDAATNRVLRKIRDLMSDSEGVFKTPTPVEVDRVVGRWNVKEKVNL